MLNARWGREDANKASGVRGRFKLGARCPEVIRLPWQRTAALRLHSFELHVHAVPELALTLDVTQASCDEIVGHVEIVP